MNGTVRRKYYGTSLCLLTIFMIAVIFLLVRLVPRAMSRAELPVFFTNSPELTETAKDFSISDYYITNKVTGLNRYLCPGRQGIDRGFKKGRQCVVVGSVHEYIWDKCF